MDGTEIAIIGMAGRFPGARDVGEFWRNLRDGVESITFFTDQELEAMGVDRALLHDPGYVKAASVFADQDAFDAEFFGINHQEAQILDPQHRVLMECAWSALEHAGYDPGTYDGPIGVYAGATINTYLLLNLLTRPDVTGGLNEVQLNISNGNDFLTTRLSYKLNLKGPSHTVQSACSTSLVAVHLACQSLIGEECDMALAGGVSVNVKHRLGYRHLPGGMTSPDGRCRAFDANAQGTIFGNGVGLVVLKRLEEALADGDSIHAVIKGSAINNDGAFKIGYTAPSVDGQAEVIAEALANAGITAEEISYIEAHGTATPLGDPVEIQALTKAFRATTDKKSYCAIGSVKSNIGHLDAAAGIAGLIKTACALGHKRLPPSLHFVTPNPAIDFANSPFYVNAELCEWRSSGAKRRAGVSAFGVGGTNAHIILEEPPASREPAVRRPAHLLIFSARSAPALQAATDNFARHLRNNRDLCLADAAHTLQVGRRAFDHRRALVCRNIDEAIRKMESGQLQGGTNGGAENTPRVVFLFPGQGAQRLQMGRTLYETEPVFREYVDRCSSLLVPHIGKDLRSVLYADRQLEEHSELLNQTHITQPALFTIEYALAQLWMSWGVKPDAMLGHSIGEYVAACLAGVFSLDDALALVSLRGRLMEEMPQGAMLALGMGADAAQPLLGDGLSLAAINAADQIVISGPAGAIAEFERRAVGQGIFAKRLDTARAFHSRMLEPIVQPYVDAVGQVGPRKPQVRFVSNVTGRWITGDEAGSPEYWGRQLREAVRFHDGVAEIVKWGGNLFIEAGPGETLTRLVRRHPGAPGAQALAALPPAEDSAPDCLLNTLGSLWCAGVEVDWKAYYKYDQRRRVALPGYPFERRRYWIEPGQGAAPAAPHHSESGKRANLSDWLYIPTWKATVAPRPCRHGALNGERYRWAIFLDGFGIGAAMAGWLRDEGHEVVTVAAGQGFKKSGADSYALDPASLGDYLEMTSDLANAGRLPQRVVHLWGLDLMAPRQSAIDAFRQAQESGCYSLFLLAYALDRHEVAASIDIHVAANDTVSITREEHLRPEKATLPGACRIIPQEFAHLSCAYTDLRLPQDVAGQATQLAELLLAEITSARTGTFAAYRAGQRFAQGFDSASLDSDPAADKGLRNGGTYLLINGLTGIGFHLAQQLAAAARPNLILIEEAPLPPRADWQSWLDGHDENAAAGQRIRNAMALTRAGAEIFVAGVDVTQSAALRHAVAEAQPSFGAINGVIYATDVGGKAAFKTIKEICEGNDWRQFETKPLGLTALNAILPDAGLDFVILSSSLSSVMGGLGSAISACANGFTDGFAIARNQAGAPLWASINWDAWQLEQEREQISALSHEIGQLAMTPAEGREVFRRILALGAASGVDQFVISTAALGPRIARWAAIEARRGALAAPGPSAGAVLHPRPQLANAYVAPASELEQRIAGVWQQAFAIEQVGIDDNFFDLGGDSLIAVQVAAQLQALLRSDVPVASLYETLTIRSLSRLLKSDQGSASRQDREHDLRTHRARHRKDVQEKQRLRKKESVASKA